MQFQPVNGLGFIKALSRLFPHVSVKIVVQFFCKVYVCVACHVCGYIAGNVLGAMGGRGAFLRPRLCARATTPAGSRTSSASPAREMGNRER